MSEIDIQKEIITLVKENAGINDDIILDHNSSMHNTTGWDSLTFLKVVTSVESRFDIKFSILEAALLTSIKAIVESVNKKLL